MKKNSLFVKIMAGAMAGVMVLIAVASLVMILIQK